MDTSYPVPKAPSVGDVAVGTRLYVRSDLVAGSTDIIIDPARSLPYLGQPTGAAKVVEYVDASGAHSGKAYFAKSAAVTNVRAVATGYTKAQYDAAVASATLAGKSVGTATDKARVLGVLKQLLGL